MVMNDYMGVMMITAACMLVLLISAFRRRKEWLINIIFRAVIGTAAIFFINGFAVSQGIFIAIGVNPLTVLTTGILGFPGLIMLYAINLYKFL